LAAAPASGNSITVNPNVQWADGILRGTVGATSTTGLPLTYTVVDAPDLGGKISLTSPGSQGQFSYLLIRRR
jgi:ABC-2 type transport system ATP-binding protein